MTLQWSLPQVVEKIRTLYSTSNTETVKYIQEELQSIQRSHDGRTLANALLNESDNTSQYFGALTYAVYINTHVLKDHIDVESISDEMFGHVLRIPLRGGMFIIRKLLSNFSVLYLNTALADPVSKLLLQLHISPLQLPTEEQVVLLSLLITTIAEDLANPSRAGTKSSDDIHRNVFPHLLQLVETFMDNNTTSLSVRSALLDAINAWVVYISNAEANSSERYTEADTEILMRWLLAQFTLNSDIDAHMQILNKAFSTLSEVVELNPRMCNPFKEKIQFVLFGPSQFGVQFIMAIILNNDAFEEYSSEASNFVNLLCTFFTYNLVYISRNILEPNVDSMLSVMLELTNHPSRPIVEEKVSEQLLPSWEELVNVYIDDQDILADLHKDALEAFMARRNEILGKVTEIYWRKSHFIDNLSRSEFIQYRHEIAELFIVLYSLLGNSLYATLCDNIADKLQQKSPEVVLDLEASLYLLSKITEDLSFYDDESYEELTPLINQLFQHNMIDVVEQTLSLPATERTTAATEQVNITLLNFLSYIPFFFKSSSGDIHLRPTFNFLFSIILGHHTLQLVNHHNLSLVASKTVLKICQGSKEKLTTFLPNLETILYEMLSNHSMDNLIRERMTNSYISIALTLKDPVQFGMAISSVLEKIHGLTTKAFNGEINVPQDMSPAEIQKAVEDYCVSLLACVNEIGAASQIPEDLDDFFTTEQVNLVNAYWQQDPLNIKARVLETVNNYSLSHPVLSRSAIVTELCCNILKLGLGEAVDGPFRFSLELLVSYVISKVPHCAPSSIANVYGLAQCVVVTNGKNIGSDVISNLVDKIFVSWRQSAEGDIEWVKCCLDFFTAILEKYPRLLLGLHVFQTDVVMFALELFKFSEVFVVKSTVKFWSTLVTMKKGSREDQNYVLDLLQSLNIGGHNLCYHLIGNLLMSFLNSPRSNLDRFYHLFRNLVGKIPMVFKQSLVAVFDTNTALIGDRLSQEQLRKFIGQLMLTRGQRQAHDVLRNFWLDYNGLQDFRRAD